MPALWYHVWLVPTPPVLDVQPTTARTDACRIHQTWRQWGSCHVRRPRPALALSARPRRRRGSGDRTSFGLFLLSHMRPVRRLQYWRQQPGIGTLEGGECTQRWRQDPTWHARRHRRHQLTPPPRKRKTLQHPPGMRIATSHADAWVVGQGGHRRGRAFLAADAGNGPRPPAPGRKPSESTAFAAIHPVLEAPKRQVSRIVPPRRRSLRSLSSLWSPCRCCPPLGVLSDMTVCGRRCSGGWTCSRRNK